MLKMVVSDLDGTLINGHNQLSFEIVDLIKELRRRGIYFAVASGRKACELRKLFEPVKDDVIFIACDGTFVTYKNEVIFKEVIEKGVILNVFKRHNIPFENIADSLGDTVKIVVKKENLTERIEEYIKINRWLSCVYEDSSLKEYVKFGKNKGTALKQLLKVFKIKNDEVVAFGDNFNDVEMLKLIPKSFAMESGKQDVKRICRYQTDDVYKSICKLLKNQEV